MKDSVSQFVNLGLTKQQIVNFTYQVSGPKSQSHTERSGMTTQSDLFQLNYTVVMLACHYGAVKILKYLHKEIVMKNENPEEVKLALLVTRHSSNT